MERRMDTRRGRATTAPEAAPESRAAFSEGELDAMALLTEQHRQELNRLSWPSEETRQQVSMRQEAARRIKYSRGA